MNKQEVESQDCSGFVRTSDWSTLADVHIRDIANGRIKKPFWSSYWYKGSYILITHFFIMIIKLHKNEINWNNFLDKLKINWICTFIALNAVRVNKNEKAEKSFGFCFIVLMVETKSITILDSKILNKSFLFVQKWPQSLPLIWFYNSLFLLLFLDFVELFEINKNKKDKFFHLSFLLFKPKFR